MPILPLVPLPPLKESKAQAGTERLIDDRLMTLDIPEEEVIEDGAKAMMAPCRPMSFQVRVTAVLRMLAPMRKPSPSEKE